MTKIIANYLPQFHAIPENSKWWGEGFTDWDTVQMALPLFEGHRQPRIPINGYYDLSVPEEIKKQADLAKKYGIYGFGIYHYWFSSEKHLLSRPAEIIKEHKEIDINYCFIWDNASWKRSWSKVLENANAWAPVFDYKDNEENCSNGILVRLQYGTKDDWKTHFDWLLPYFKDKRYIKKSNSPVFVIFNQHNNSRLLLEMFDYWNELAIQNGFSGIYIVGRHKKHSTSIADTEFKYQPIYDGWEGLGEKISRHLCKDKIRYYDYDCIWKKIIKGAKKDRNKQIFSGAFVGYDDTPRRGRKGKIVLGASPEKFGRYLKELVDISDRYGKEFVFLTAWNEWGEGAYLEPDNEYGYKYLEAIKNVIDVCN